MLEGDDGFFMGEQGADETLRGMIEELKAQIESMKASERPVDNPQPAPAAEADDFAKLQRALMDSSISDAAEDQAGGDYDPVPFEVPEPEIRFHEDPPAGGVGVAKVFEPVFAEGLIADVGEGCWAAARKLYWSVDASEVIGQGTGLVFLLINHSSAPTAKLVMDWDGTPSDTECAFPLYRISNGAITVDYRGFPMAQIWE